MDTIGWHVVRRTPDLGNKGGGRGGLQSSPFTISRSPLAHTDMAPHRAVVCKGEGELEKSECGQRRAVPGQRRLPSGTQPRL
ncbi:hypothetical protein E2C01_074565 [Portunus trituberculatus]|uniref:Uncharacterized protein n=1 Tax=Portunus trituberculatus TaxID=210409 RepID=A0A5B7ICK5_PORTR|nr:hypothetical protein [Portunus trituberculatus]